MNQPDCYPCGTPRPRSKPRRFAFLWMGLVGFASLVWLLLRSGGKPSRIAYPCQAVASQLVWLAFGAAAIPWLRSRAEGRATGGAARRAAGWVGLPLVISLVLTVTFFSDQPPSIARGRASVDYRAQLYVVHDAGGPIGDHHAGLDALLGCMDAGGLPFYNSASIGPETGPGGVIGAHDVVLIKVNQQWDERGGTNTDVLKGLITRVVEHPDGFDGEVVVIENTQGYGTLNWVESNAEDHAQSAQDVVQQFAIDGYAVSGFLLDTIRTRSVAEYSSGDMQDGYVVGPLDGGTQSRVSYPKFRTAGERYVSLKYGVWSPATSSYSDAEFTFLSVPVLKCHGAVYGVTAATKHHVGSMTTSLSTNTHSGVRYGGLGRFLADVRLPDLNILDCIYILAQPSAGPACSYTQATRVNTLVAGVDPIAIDMWATTEILVPTIVANGYTSYPKQDPTDPSSIFRTYLDRSMDVLLASGIDVTNDMTRIDALEMTASDVPGESTGHGVMSYPNPTEGGCRILFDLSRAARVQVELFDAGGRRIRVIERDLSAGAAREVFWDGADDAGRAAARGHYTYRVIRPEGMVVGRLTRL